MTMKSDKHTPKLGEGTTPGPWHVEPGEWCDGEDGHGIAICSKDGVVAIIDNDDDGMAPDDMPNAALIAKSPLLIECREVIEGLMKDLEMWPGDKNPEFFYSMKKARALLAKLEE